MNHWEIKMFLVKRYSLDAATASEHARVLMEDHHYISDCPKTFTLKTPSEYLDKMENY